MKVTVCQLSNNTQQLEKDWEGLVSHCKKNKSELILLPEMPFSSWFATKPSVSDSIKLDAVKAHEEWIERFDELGDAVVAYTKPEIKNGKFFNIAYVWSKKSGHIKVHTKYYLPEEVEAYEATWFDRESKHFETIEINGVRIGFLLCTEIWFTQHTRKYGLQGIDLLLCPRATSKYTIDQWVRCGQTSSVIGGCYCLSSNRAGIGDNDFHWGGTAWIAQPVDGALLGTTSEESPFLTLDIDLKKAKSAKKEYPLYVNE
ncbi:carbon-nitrogen hydrolase family protein [Puteibacter caeruleilacunae]|nr:carbon-nitrogen hydrolase family protein [Puteibacter caeruleilacunae]